MSYTPRRYSSPRTVQDMRLLAKEAGDQLQQNQDLIKLVEQNAKVLELIASKPKIIEQLDRLPFLMEQLSRILKSDQVQAVMDKEVIGKPERVVREFLQSDEVNALIDSQERLELLKDMSEHLESIKTMTTLGFFKRIWNKLLYCFAFKG